MRLKDPPKRGWKHSKTGWQIYIWSIFMIPTALIVTLHIVYPSFLDTFTITLLLIVTPLSSIAGTIDFTGKEVSKDKQVIARRSNFANLLIVFWAIGIGTLIGSVYTFFVLDTFGLGSDYLAITAFVFLVAIATAIAFLFLGQLLISRKRTA